MLDKTSENFLKLLISKYQKSTNKSEIIIYGNEVNMDCNELNSICLYLYNNKYILDFVYAYQTSNYVTIHISHAGLHYFENKHKQNIKFWLPLIVSNAIAFIALIVAILAYIKQ